jgi:tetratricopeptide (TPR) repeat protein
LGDYRRTIEYCDTALELLRELHDRRTHAETCDSLGFAHYHVGAYKDAVRCYSEGLRLAKQLGDRYLEGEILDHLGDVYLASGERDRARSIWQKAFGVFKELRQPEATGVKAKLGRLDLLP